MVIIRIKVYFTLLLLATVEALRYKSEDRAFDSRWCHRNFSLT